MLFLHKIPCKVFENDVDNVKIVHTNVDDKAGDWPQSGHKNGYTLLSTRTPPHDFFSPQFQ